MLPNRIRWFCVTDWNLNKKDDYQKIVDKGQIKFIAWGEETCPNTGKLHNQMYCYFHNPKSWTGKNLLKIGEMFGDTHCHVSPKRGDIPANEAYCSKEGTLLKVGDEPRQGMRGDIDETVKMISKDELCADDICVDNPLFYHMYGRTFEKAEQIALRKKFRNFMTKGTWYWGKSGCGKSHTAFKNFNPDTHYVKNLNEEWWDGYKGQEIVILNEFRGQIRFSELLDLVDKWPKSVKWRGRESVPFLAKEVIITSIKHPEDCFESVIDEPWDQFNRRFKIVKLKHRNKNAQKYSIGNNELLSETVQKSDNNYVVEFD